MPGRTLHITKMHGAGNDFILIDNPDIADEHLATLVPGLCNRHLGVGADGLLVVRPSAVADARMIIFNSDGTRAEMCGNGIRCVAKYLYDSSAISTATPVIETDAGLKPLVLTLSAEGKVDSVTVNMGKASLLNDGTPISAGHAASSHRFIPVTVGNPHAVVIAPGIGSIDIVSDGPAIEHHTFWPEKANVEFIEITSPHSIVQRTWERGVGETLACGTGACAAAFAAVSTGKAQWPVSVTLSGGRLIIDFDPASGNIFLTGEAAIVFDSKINV